MSARSEVPALERAALHLYQLYDLGDSIDLEQARAVLAAPSMRMRPVVTRGGNIDIPHPPLVVGMEQAALCLGGLALEGQMVARVYDLGIVAVCLMLRLPSRLPWDRALDLAAAAQVYPDPALDLFAGIQRRLAEALRPAIAGPYPATRTEDYTVFVVESLGPGIPAARLGPHPLLLGLALGERRTLSEGAAALATALSYYEDDLILLTWNGAVVIEPDALAREDATFLLEFANVQLLAFRSYDDQVEQHLTRIGPRITRIRRPRWWLLRSTTSLLHEIHSLIAETTEASARVQNALKVTDDVYWNRVYTAALGVLRVGVWQTSIAGRLDVLRQAVALLHDEAEVARATLLELLVIVLIAVELVVMMVGPVR